LIICGFFTSQEECVLVVRNIRILTQIKKESHT
jgi:hypothetical protein